MPEFPTNSLFYSNEIVSQIEELKSFTDNFIQKHQKAFEKDKDDKFLVFNFSFPKKDGEKERVDWKVEYSDELPEDIIKEFEDELKIKFGNPILRP